jgi:hypothetical protein
MANTRIAFLQDSNKQWVLHISVDIGTVSVRYLYDRARLHSENEWLDFCLGKTEEVGWVILREDNIVVLNLEEEGMMFMSDLSVRFEDSSFLTKLKNAVLEAGKRGMFRK